MKLFRSLGGGATLLLAALIARPGLQGADVNLFLAELALTPAPLPEGEGRVREIDKVKAKEYAEEAKKLATCDGPPYYYKVAYEEAERFLENLK